MSMAEPLMPADEPKPTPPATDHDVDHDTDVILNGGDDDGSEETAGGEDPEPDYPLSATFHTPEPGAKLTAEQLERDLADE